MERRGTWERIRTRSLCLDERQRTVHGVRRNRNNERQGKRTCMERNDVTDGHSINSGHPEK